MNICPLNYRSAGASANKKDPGDEVAGIFTFKISKCLLVPNAIISLSYMAKGREIKLRLDFGID